MPFSGLSGQAGSIPNSVFREKYEVTNMYESNTDVSDYFRSTLKDIKPDAPMMESDRHRSNENFSEEFLSMRYNAHRSGEVPDHSEMFLELTDKDPRGTALGPNMRHTVDQAYSRKDYIKYYPDSDNSVPEREKRPQQLMQQMRDSFYGIKNRLKIFSTSKDGMAAAKNFRFSQDSVVDVVDGKNYNVSGSISTENINKPSTWVSDFSNYTPIGWERTTDHEFAIAEYGQVRTHNPSDYSDVSENRYNQNIQERKDVVVFDDRLISAEMAKFMGNVTSRGTKNALDQNSERVKIESSNSGVRFESDDFKIRRETFAAANAKSIESVTKKYAKDTTPSVINNVHEIDIKNAMEAATRSKTKQQKIIFTNATLSKAMEDPRYSAAITKLMSMKDFKPFVRNTNISKSQSLPSGMEVTKLGSYKLPIAIADQLKKVFRDHEGKPDITKYTQLKMGTTKKMINNNLSKEEQRHETFGTKDRFTKMGTKFVRDKTENTIERLGINDV